MSTQSRNSITGMNDKDTRPGLDSAGVGGRQEHRCTPNRGGGYLDICKKSEKAIYEKMLNDSRIDELKAHGLSDTWIEVAEDIGYDQFIRIWQILDKKNINKGHHDNARIRIPIFAQFLKFQRNKYILHLSEIGHSPEEIKNILKKDLCEDLTIRHINRLLLKGTIK